MALAEAVSVAVEEAVAVAEPLNEAEGVEGGLAEEGGLALAMPLPLVKGVKEALWWGEGLVLVVAKRLLEAKEEGRVLALATKEGVGGRVTAVVGLRGGLVEAEALSMDEAVLSKDPEGMVEMSALPEVLGVSVDVAMALNEAAEVMVPIVEKVESVLEVEVETALFLLLPLAEGVELALGRDERLVLTLRGALRTGLSEELIRALRVLTKE